MIMLEAKWVIKLDYTYARSLDKTYELIESKALIDLTTQVVILSYFIYVVNGL